ncbi:MAG: hypothetical protein U5M23_15595 [Marinagarivorans sp.]|nr:hypothetical protein [Marinagarivorans sp.]
MAVIPIVDSRDARVAPFRDRRERDLTGREGLFVAEGGSVAGVLASPASLCRPVAALIAEKRIAALADVIDALAVRNAGLVRAPNRCWTASPAFICTGAFWPLARNPLRARWTTCLPAWARTPSWWSPAESAIMTTWAASSRAAAAFGAAAVLLDDRCCDPFYRKAIRVSVGAVLRTPMSTGLDAGEMVEGLQAAGFLPRPRRHDPGRRRRRCISPSGAGASPSFSAPRGPGS